MEHLRHHQRYQERDEDDGDQALSHQPQGYASLPDQVTENTLSGPWARQYPNVHSASIPFSPPVQANQFIPAQYPQHGSQIPEFGQLQDQSLSPLSSNYHPENQGSQDRRLPHRPPPHPNQRSRMQRTQSISTVPTNASIGSRLDSEYKMRGSDYFIPGIVFACLWTEPLGETTSHKPHPSPKISAICFGEFAYSNILRFVVILTPYGEQFSVCCPIKTYGHKGTAKNQSAHHHHSMIYSTGTQPQRVRGEADFIKKAIEMEPENNRDSLNSESRLNFAKPTPVEHNLRVKHLGRITPEHIRRLFRYYREENGASAIQRAENMATRTAKRLDAGPRNFQSDLLDGVEYEDDSDDNYDDDDDEVSLEGRHRRRASSRRTLAEHPHVERSSYTQTHRGRRDTGVTSRSSPVPVGSPRPMGENPRRLTQGQIELPPSDPKFRHSTDPNRRDDGRHGSYK